MTKEKAKEMKNTIEKLSKEGLTAEGIAEKMELSSMTVYKYIKKFGLKTNGKKRGFRAIGGKVFEDYQKGLTVKEIAEKYDREPKAVRKFVCYRKNYKADNKGKTKVKAMDVVRLRTQSALYQDKLDKVKRNLKVGECVRYNGENYTVIEKYRRFAVLQGKEYQITVMYDDFVRQAECC